MRHIFLVFLMMFSFTAAGCKAEERVVADTPVLESQEEFCGVSGRTLFGFKDPDHTQFSIPNAYLFDPYNAYHKVKDPADFISIRFWKDSLKPVCPDQDIGDNSGSRKVLEVSFKPMRLSIVKETSLRNLLVVPDEDVQFNVYRTEKAIKTGNLAATRDFLIPKNQDEKDKAFIKCSYSLPSKKPVVKEACHVFSAVTETVLSEYVIHHTDLKDYKKIADDVSKLILSFELPAGGTAP